MYDKFLKDLDKSHGDVALVSKFLKTKGATDLGDNHDKKYDIVFKLNNELHTIEVKHDYKFQDTGNVAVEFESRKKPSGIVTTTASLWCYVLGNDIYISTTNRLKILIRTNTFPVKPAGDNLSSLVYLIPMRDFLKVFKKYTDL